MFLLTVVIVGLLLLCPGVGYWGGEAGYWSRTYGTPGGLLLAVAIIVLLLYAGVIR